MELSTGYYTHVGVRKDGNEIYMTQGGESVWTKARQEGYGMLIVLRDLKGNVVFKGNADEIVEVREINLKNEAEKTAMKTKLDQIEKEYAENKSKKKAWTDRKLRETSDEEIEYFLGLARDKLKTAISTGRVGDKFVNEYAMCLFREYHKCPFR